MIVYGIKNCETVKKALTWLDDKKIRYEFHDYKSKGVESEKLNTWVKQVGWETLVNRKGMTWRQLDDKAKDKVVNAAAAVALMQEKTSVIKRPLIEQNNKVLAVGFDPETYQKLLK